MSAGLDFDALYRGEPLYPEGHPLRPIYRDVVPWDIGGPQPAIVELAAAGGFRGDVLDAGCGFGDHALFLAGQGHRVTGIDIAPSAIRQATARSAALGRPAEFLLVDATKPDELAGRVFDTILDSDLFHGLGRSQQLAYLTAMRALAAPGARLHLHCATEAMRANTEAEHAAEKTAEDVAATLVAAGWALTRFAHVHYAANPAFTRKMLRRGMAATGAVGGQRFVDDLVTDRHGRLLLPMWSITAIPVGGPR